MIHHDLENFPSESIELLMKSKGPYILARTKGSFTIESRTGIGIIEDRDAWNYGTKQRREDFLRIDG